MQDNKKKQGIPGSVAFIIGPEGGFSAEEIQQADLPKVTLGPRILRTETASAAVLSMIMYEFELDQGAKTFNSP